MIFMASESTIFKSFKNGRCVFRIQTCVFFSQNVFNSISVFGGGVEMVVQRNYVVVFEEVCFEKFGYC